MKYLKRLNLNKSIHLIQNKYIIIKLNNTLNRKREREREIVHLMDSHAYNRRAVKFIYRWHVFSLLLMSSYSSPTPWQTITKNTLGRSDRVPDGIHYPRMNGGSSFSPFFFCESVASTLSKRVDVATLLLTHPKWLRD